MKIFEYIDLFFIGIKYYVYNFTISLSEFILIPLIAQKFIPLKNLITNYFKFIFLKILVFYEYFFLPPRWVIPLEIKKFNIKNPENYTYGETPYLTILKIIQDIINETQKKDFIFIDLGCGVGKTVFTINIFFNIPTIGIDNIQTFINKANKIKKILKLSKVNFIKSDILEFLEKGFLEEKFFKISEIFEKDKKAVFFIPATAFEEKFFYEIIQKIILNFGNSLIISVSKPISKQKLNFLNISKIYILKLLSQEYFFSWGKSKVFVYLLSPFDK